MYLQSLELIGFKSFAQKTVLNFHRGVTAVVGPNGCGKSNVLDAIRWVLGEQSAKALRGGEMADVIFSGTDSRQALGMAEVSLTFAECEKELGVEWNEVRITRRVFRDGQSEYLLNKTPCRLRDIHQLFMDTGIGRSAYSIMEQGKIDQILSSKPEDRRAIFEEAAGITSVLRGRNFFCGPLGADEQALVRTLFPAVEPLLAVDAERGAELFNLTGRRVRSLADCLIAAVAMRCGARLATGNQADFQPMTAHGLQPA